MKWYDVTVVNEGIRLRAMGESPEDVKARFEEQLQRTVEVGEPIEGEWFLRADGTEARHHPSREPAGDEQDGQARVPLGPQEAPNGLELHVFKDGREDGDDVGDWCAWLNTGTSDFDGLCLASGEDRHEVLAQAYQAGKDLAEAAIGLQKKY